MPRQSCETGRLVVVKRVGGTRYLLLLHAIYCCKNVDGWICIECWSTYSSSVVCKSTDRCTRRLACSKGAARSKVQRGNGTLYVRPPSTLPAASASHQPPHGAGYPVVPSYPAAVFDRPSATAILAPHAIHLNNIKTHCPNMIAP